MRIVPQILNFTPSVASFLGIATNNNQTTTPEPQPVENFKYQGLTTDRIKDPQKRAEAFDLEGRVLFAEGHYQEALAKFKDALRIKEGLYLGDKQNLEIADSYRNLGAAYYRLNDFYSALQNHQKALEIRESTLGRNNLITSDSYENIGVVYRSLGDTTQALHYLNTALEIRQTLEQSTRTDTMGVKLKIATSLYDLGTVYRDMGHLKRSLELHTQALSIRTRYLKDSSNHELIESSLSVRELELLMSQRPQ